MIRALASAILGYVVMVVGAIGGIVVLWFALGSRFAFDGESTRASTPWSVAMLLIGFVAAVIAGLVAAKVGGSVGHRAVRILVILVLILGTAQFVMQRNHEPRPLPEGTTIHDLSFFDAGNYAVSPTWYNVAIVVVVVGGSCCRATPDA